MASALIIIHLEKHRNEKKYVNVEFAKRPFNAHSKSRIQEYLEPNVLCLCVALIQFFEAKKKK